MKLGIILNTNDPEVVWNCFRCANEALKNNHSVKIFLLGTGVYAEGLKDDKYPLLQGAIQKFLKNNGSISVCGTCLTARGKQSAYAVSTMDDMLKIVEESDKVLTFG